MRKLENEEIRKLENQKIRKLENQKIRKCGNQLENIGGAWTSEENEKYQK